MRKFPVSVLLSTEMMVVVTSVVFILAPGLITTEQLLDILAMFAVGLGCRIFVLGYILKSKDDSLISNPRDSLILYFATNATLIFLFYGILGSEGAIEALLLQSSSSIFIYMVFVTTNTFIYHYMQSSPHERVSIVVSNFVKWCALIVIASDLFSRFLSLYMSQFGSTLFFHVANRGAQIGDVTALMYWFIGFVVLDLVLWWYFHRVHKDKSTHPS